MVKVNMKISIKNVDLDNFSIKKFVSCDWLHVAQHVNEHDFSRMSQV